MISDIIPINGRIAIVDDQIDQVLPLMNLFSKLQIPYIYYNNDPKYLPEKGKAYNDVRILLLDINLIDDTRREAKELKAALIPTIDRIISDHNYPYLLIYWSRHEDEYNDLLKEIFTTDLPTKAPISYLSLQKEKFIQDDGNATAEADQPDLMEIIKLELAKFPIYGHLINWENRIHLSADKTLEEIFKLKAYEDDWNKDSNSLFYKLALAYSGKQLHGADAVDQIKSAFFSLNYVFTDSLEAAIGQISGNDYLQLEKSEEADLEMVYKLNKKLLLSDEKSPVNKPGLILKSESLSKARTVDFKNLLNDCINRASLCELIKAELKKENSEYTEAEIKKKSVKRESEFRKEIKSSWCKIFLVVTPLCDYAQTKFIYNKLVSGIIIEAKFRDFINRSSEAIFISPTFSISDEQPERILVLDFRHFFSARNLNSKSLEPLFRLRQTLLAEIQSKLSRHINRQGILFVEE